MSWRSTKVQNSHLSTSGARGERGTFNFSCASTHLNFFWTSLTLYSSAFCCLFVHMGRLVAIVGVFAKIISPNTNHNNGHCCKSVIFPKTAIKTQEVENWNGQNAQNCVLYQMTCPDYSNSGLGQLFQALLRITPASTVNSWHIPKQET